MTFRFTPQIEHLEAFASSGTGSRLRVQSVSGASTVHVARWPLTTHRLQVVVHEEITTVMEWCAETGIREAMNGGFVTKPEWSPLGQVWLEGSELPFTPFDDDWHAERGALHVPPEGPPVCRARSEFPTLVPGSLLQAGPLLVRDGIALGSDADPEGFSSTGAEFESDITEEPLPRAAIAVSDDAILGVCVDGRVPGDAGMLLTELAQLLVELGASSALNLDGGSSSTLVTAGTLRNVPRDDQGAPIPAGRPTRTMLAVHER